MASGSNPAGDVAAFWPHTTLSLAIPSPSCNSTCSGHIDPYNPQIQQRVISTALSKSSSAPYPPKRTEPFHGTVSARNDANMLFDWLHLFLALAMDVSSRYCVLGSKQEGYAISAVRINRISDGVIFFHNNYYPIPRPATKIWVTFIGASQALMIEVTT